MIVDSSVLVAILRREPDMPQFVEALKNAPHRRVSAGNFLEAAIVIDASRNPLLSRRFTTFMEEAEITIEPVTEAQVKSARDAYRDFGKGSGHPAQLNLGDCFAYALAKAMGEPLLFKGNGFQKTDVAPALGR